MSALIFDCDGTLADTMPAHFRAWQDVLRPLAIPFPETRFYALGGVPTVAIARMLLGEAGRSDLDPIALARSKEDTFLVRFDEVKPIEKVVAIARAAYESTPMAVASGGHRDLVERTLRHIGVRDWFRAVVTSEDTPRHKPGPDVFLEAARRLGVRPDLCTVYDDTDLGLEGARRAGMHAVDIRVLP